MISPAQQDALAKIASASVLCERVTGCPAELTAAQCIFESAWLSRCPGNNCFGIKADDHGTGAQYVLTHEYLNGSWQHLEQSFETYASLSDCFIDHARLIQTGAYYAAWSRYTTNHDLDALIAGVAAHYATDPNYAAEIDREAHSVTVQQSLLQAREAVVATAANVT